MDKERTYALITGGSAGIGLALCHEFALRDHNIAIVALPDSGQKEAIQELENKHNVKVKSLEINLIEDGAIEKVIQWLENENIHIQALVNNAGMGYAGRFEKLSSDFISNLIGINIKVTTLLTHALIPELKKNKRSFILNLSSAAAFYSMPFKSVYAASKKYVLDYSLSLHEETKEDGLFITAVCPAGVITNKAQRERIKDAGWLARKSALEPEQVAKESIQAMLANKRYIVPGKLARIMAAARFVVPSALQRRLIAKNFRKGLNS